MYNHYSVISSHEKERNNSYNNIAISFEKNPNISDGAKLMDYYFDRKDYKKALFYANRCVDLGANSTQVGFNINFVIAMSYHRLNNLEMAKKHLITALELDSEGVIKKNSWIEQAGLNELL
jgi:tetratricopeptide (TPR) repeat protein